MPQSTTVFLKTRQEASVKIPAHIVRTVGVALTFAAVISIGACQDVVVDSNARQSATVLRGIPGESPSAPVTFDKYSIIAVSCGAKFFWRTDVLISTRCGWCVDGEGVLLAVPGLSSNLVTTHYASIIETFEIGTVYEFQAYGYDIDGTIHLGAVLHFQRYAPPVDYVFVEV